VTRRDLENHLLHVVARVALRLTSPLRAKRIVDAAAGLLPPLASDEEAERGARLLEPSGTCLSQALVVAARLPGAVVVIGQGRGTGRRFVGHAWVERAGKPITGAPPSPEEYEIARLR
jgi:hypothetical protein